MVDCPAIYCFAAMYVAYAGLVMFVCSPRCFSEQGSYIYRERKI